MKEGAEKALTAKFREYFLATIAEQQQFGLLLWQNRLNYSSSSALIIAIQPILTQRTSNGTIHWSVGSPPDTTTV
jgi:hypothetical protein